MRLPFAALAGDPLRPYPPTGLTTALWQQIPVKSVYIQDLHLTQTGVLIGPLFGFRDGNGSTDTYPHVVSWRGELYLEDGHTRVVYQALAGTRVMRMRVFVQEENT
jgi:hypothetical protein